MKEYNLPECKYGLDDKKCETSGIAYDVCYCSLNEKTLKMI